MSGPHAGKPLLGERYELGDRIGSGGMADVYRAVDRVLGRDVALKVLNAERAADATFRERFRREARAAARLNHSNIVAIYDWGTPAAAAAGADGGRFDRLIVMEYVSGGNLGDALARRGPLPEAEALGIADQIAAALEAAHRQGVIHRDIKPQNVLLTADGQVKVADFGIARATGTEPVTRASEVLGSAGYLSPEQAQGKPVDARSDLYSLGVVLYQLLTGRTPFDGDTPVAVALRHVRDLPEPPRRRNPFLSAVTEAIVLRLLAKDPAQRFQSATELRTALLEARERIPGAGATARPDDRQRLGRVVRPTRPPGSVAPTRSRRRRPAAWPLALLPLALLLLLGAAIGIGRVGGAARTAPPAGGMGPGSAVVAGPPATTAEAPALVPATQTPAIAAGGAVATATAPAPAASATTVPATAATVPATATSVPAAATPTAMIAAATAAPAAMAADRAVPPTATPTSFATAVRLRAAPFATAAFGPAQTVIQFYTSVGEHRFAQAAQLWSPAMRAAYPPASNIDGRFAAVQQTTVRQAVQTAIGAGRATVAVDVVEIDAGSPPVTREYVGTWQLVAGPSGWLLDQPDLRQVR